MPSLAETLFSELELELKKSPELVLGLNGLFRIEVTRKNNKLGEWHIVPKH